MSEELQDALDALKSAQAGYVEWVGWGIFLGGGGLSVEYFFLWGGGVEELNIA